MKNYGFILAGMIAFTLLISCTTQKTTDSNSTMKYNIERIEYFTSACFGPCPMFKMEINKDRMAVYNAIRFNFSKDFEAPHPEGTFVGKIKELDYDSLVQKLNDMDFPMLQDQYKVGYTDAQTGNLKIIYDGGKEKAITDYGMRGTPELEEIYQLFLDLRENQEWKKFE